MRAAAPSRHLHPALAVLMALALHAAALVGARWAAPAAALAPRSYDVDTEIELPFSDSVGPEAAPAPLAPAIARWTSIESARAPPHEVAREHRRLAISPLPPEADAADPADGSHDVTDTPSSSTGHAPPPAIDLGLDDGVRRAALREGWLEPPSRPSRPTDGGLRQGLAALDAERGLSRSSPAHHAAYVAARRFAPKTGIGTFEVTADERGSVLSVSLAGASANAAEWQRVADDLQQLLKDRRLRVPPGAKGLVARLRIETGDLAKHTAERFRVTRGTGLGPAPLHPRELRAESTRGQLEPGQLSPTLGITVAGAGGASDTLRVVLVEERAL
jgi:hypothetical protein